MSKVNNHKVAEFLPYGLLATKKWLLGKGLSVHSIDNAVKSQKLESLASGVYSRAGLPITWEGVVCSMQKMSDEYLHLGGLSALQLLGYAQYLSRHQKTQHLYSQSKSPTWLNKLGVSTTFNWHSTIKLWDSGLELESYVIQHHWREDLPPITISCPEKAYLELLMSVPKDISFEHADELMQGMTSLSPRKLNVLLHACRSVKVKRLFFWLADRHNYAWLQKLNYREFDLGKGKRVIADKGKFDNKYNITVPEYLHG